MRNQFFTAFILASAVMLISFIGVFAVAHDSGLEWISSPKSIIGSRSGRRDTARDDIHKAVRSGDADLVQKILDARPEKINLPDSSGNTPLNLAVISKNKTILKILLARGADIDKPDNNGFTPLINAVRLRNEQTALQLVNAGADPDAQNTWGMNALHFAYIFGQGQVVPALIKKGASRYVHDFRGQTPVMYAIRRGNDGLFRMYLKTGGNIAVKDEGGNGLIMIAAFAENGEIVRLCTEYGADINDKNSFGQTAVHKLAIDGNTEMLNLALKLGCGADGKDLFGKNPAYYARYHEHPVVCEMLKTRTAAQHENMDSITPVKDLLSAGLAKGEAYLFYLGHSGWAVRTAGNFLIFDYYNYGKAPAHSTLANGHINMQELDGLNITVCTSHAHRDHFNKSILDWRKENPAVRYVFGWQAEQGVDNFYLANSGETYRESGLSITAFSTPDPGAGFLVESDGLRFFFGGDFFGPYKEHVREIQERCKRLDFGCVCAFSGPMDVARYVIEKLPTENIFLMHAGRYEHFLKKFVDENAADYPNKHLLYPLNRGDRFHILNGKIEKL